MFPINNDPPKKYIKDEGNNKLILNPEYKRWMEMKLNNKNEDNDTAEYNNSTNTPFAVAVAVAVAVDIETETEIDDVPTDPLVHCNSEHQQQFPRQSEELELIRLRFENQRLNEIEQLKQERDRLEKSQKESNELRLLKEENEKLKRIAKKNAKKAKASAAAPKPSACPKPQSDTQLFAATVPIHIRPGQKFKVHVKGQQYVVVCPRNARGGQIIHVPIKIIPQQQPMLYTVKIPMGIRPGQIFKINAKGRIYNVKCPIGARGGKTIRVPIQ
jgi:septum formation inhibitor MinC